MNPDELYSGRTMLKKQHKKQKPKAMKPEQIFIMPKKSKQKKK